MKIWQEHVEIEYGANTLHWDFLFSEKPTSSDVIGQLGKERFFTTQEPLYFHRVKEWVVEGWSPWGNPVKIDQVEIIQNGRPSSA